MTIGSLPPTVASPDCLLPIACKGSEDAVAQVRAGRDTAEHAAKGFATYAPPSEVTIRDLGQPDAPPAAACTALGKVARLGATAVRELAFTPPAAYAILTVARVDSPAVRDLAHLAVSPFTYMGMKAGEKIADAILGRKD
jgi:hypothetical protein